MVTNKAIEVVGSRGTFRQLPLERALRDVRTFTRDSRATRRIAEAALTGEHFSKQAYGPRSERLTWEQIGIEQPVTA